MGAVFVTNFSAAGKVERTVQQVHRRKSPMVGGGGVTRLRVVVMQQAEH